MCQTFPCSAEHHRVWERVRNRTGRWNATAAEACWWFSGQSQSSCFKISWPEMYWLNNKGKKKLGKRCKVFIQVRRYPGDMRLAADISWYGGGSGVKCCVEWKQPSRTVLVHEVKALVWEQRSKALPQVVVGILCERHLLHGGQLAVAGPDLLTGWP